MLQFACTPNPVRGFVVCERKGERSSFALRAAYSAFDCREYENREIPFAKILGAVCKTRRRFFGKSAGADDFKNLSRRRTKSGRDGQRSRKFPAHYDEGAFDAAEQYERYGYYGLRRRRSRDDSCLERICARRAYARRLPDDCFACRRILYSAEASRFFFSRCNERHGGIR